LATQILERIFSLNKIKKVNGNFELFYDEIKELLQKHDEDLF